MTSRTYGQYCPVAHALDEIGDRWGLLILRDLSFGPQRFTDLRESLTGLAPNLLTERLRSLEDAGLVSREELPPPAARTVYALTRAGLAVVPVLVALARFGAHRLPVPSARTLVKPRAALVASVIAFHQPGAVTHPDATYRFLIDDQAYDVDASTARLRRADNGVTATVTISAAPRVLLAIRRGDKSFDQCATSGEINVEGTRSAVRSLRAAFAL